MQSGGCREIAFGLESGSRTSLQKMNKGVQIALDAGRKAEGDCLREQVGERIQLCLDHDIVPRTHFMIGFHWESRDDILDTVRLSVFLKAYGLTDANFFVVKTYPGTPMHYGIHRLQAEGGISDARVYDVWSVFDWDSTKNPKVAAKLRRFNDIPRHSMHPHLDSLSLRRLVRNAYEIFFSTVPLEDVENSLWTGVAWQT
jgi:hypothetical protein